MFGFVKRFILVIVCVFLTGCLGHDETPSHEEGPSAEVSRISIDVDTTLILGDQIDAPRNFVFGAPEDIAVDSSGNIYVADEGAMQVMKYSSSGEYLTSMGRRGEGPGEFQHMHDLLITKDQKLIVLGSYTVGWFHLNGDHVRTLSISDVHRKIVQFDTDKYLLIDHDVNTRDSLFHIRTSDLDYVESFGPVTEYINLDGAHEGETRFEDLRLRNHAGSAEVLDSGGVLYAPYLFDGQLRLYERQSKGWHQTRMVYGHVHTQEPYSRVEPGKKAMVTGGGYDYGYDYNNMSLGLHQDEKGYVFHFTAIDSASYRIFGVEIYDPNLDLMGYASITRTYSENGRPLIFYPFVAAAGPDRQFFLLKKGYWGDEIPHITRISIDIESSS